jgi:hypothetical protein
LKKVLIISPYFPPTNAADMQRVRMSLPYFKHFGWEADVVTVDEKYSDLAKDELLLQTVPSETVIHKVKALNKSYTSKLGLGSIALRSLWFYRQKVNELLKNGKYDLIYFSTTQFPVCILGAYWKKRFNIPYIIDMQDPWHSDYYVDKPKDQQPAKYWLSYRLNKYLEPKAMKHVDGLISVSESYIADLKGRYPQIKNIPAATITFGAFGPDLKIAAANAQDFKPLLDAGHTNIAYVGRGGADMHKAVGVVFKAMQDGLKQQPEKLKKLRFYFIGTSYAPAGKGQQTIMPLAKEYGIEDYVIEITDRISYYHTLTTLQQADALFIPGSDDSKYTASKIYPCLLTQKPMLAVFNKASSVIDILREYGVKQVYNYDDVTQSQLIEFFDDLVDGHLPAQQYNAAAIKKYSAQQMTLLQCKLFDTVINGKN